jgi:hypothetical protein
MNDLISRQAAIDLFPNDALEWDTNGGYIAPHLARQMIEELPSAQPVRHGKWIFGSTLGHSWMKCSECCVSQDGQTLCFSYCPNCGTRMDGGG